MRHDASQVSDIMKSSLATVGPDDSIDKALQTMLWSGGRHLPVVEHGKLIGVISERDVLRHRGGDEGLELRVRDAMSLPVHSAAPDDPVQEVALRMADERIGCMPVLQRGDLVGMVTATDVLAFEGRRSFATGNGEHTAGDLMTHDPMTVHPDDSLEIAVDRMVSRNVRHLPVIDGEGRLVGMLEDRAIRPTMARDRATLQVSAVMDPDPFTVEPSASYGMLTGLFADSRLSAVAVVDAEQRLLGIVSYVDLLRHAPPEPK